MEVQNLTYYLQQARETAKPQEMEAKEIEPTQTTTATWNRETVQEVMKSVSTKVPQRDLISLLLVSPWLYRTLTSYPPLWMVCSSFFSSLFGSISNLYGLIMVLMIWDLVKGS